MKLSENTLSRLLSDDNDSIDQTAGIYEKSGIPCYTECQHSFCIWGKQAHKDIHVYELNAIMPKWHELFESQMK